MENETKYFVYVTDYMYTTCGGSGRGTFKEYFDTIDEVKKFLEDMSDKEKFSEYSKKECGGDGYIEKIDSTIYKTTTITETI